MTQREKDPKPGPPLAGQPVGPGPEAAPACPGASSESNEPGCPRVPSRLPGGIESILRRLDRLFWQDSLRRLAEQEKEGKPHE